MPGLPCVPPPQDGELLGAWLLRVARVYSMPLRALLVRLNALPTDAPAPRWHTLRTERLDMDTLAAAVHQSPQFLAAMSSVTCHPRRPSEMGFCRQCLHEDVQTGRTPTWRRRWMHPLTVACEEHSEWLTPISSLRMCATEREEDFWTLAVAPPPTAQVSTLVGQLSDALWLQLRCVEQAHVDSPWGRCPGHRFIAVVDQLARAIHCVAQQLGVIHLIDLVDLVALPTDLSAWSMVDLSFKSVAGPNAGAALPTSLGDRQRWLAMMGSLIRQPPLHWPPALVPLFPSTKHWVDGPLRWLCPEAADLVHHVEEMRSIYRDAWRSSRQTASTCDAAD